MYISVYKRKLIYLIPQPLKDKTATYPLVKPSLPLPHTTLSNPLTVLALNPINRAIQFSPNRKLNSPENVLS
jgi:hypothetical protein